MYEKTALNCLNIYFDIHRFVRNNYLVHYLFISEIAFLLFFTNHNKTIIYGVNAVEMLVTEGGLPYLKKVLTLNVEDIKEASVSQSVCNSLKQLGLILLIILLSFIPVVAIVMLFITLFVRIYCNGLLMTDYTLERQGYSVKQSEIFYKTHQSEMFAIGLGFMFLLIIPLLVFSTNLWA